MIEFLVLFYIQGTLLHTWTLRHFPVIKKVAANETSIFPSPPTYSAHFSIFCNLVLFLLEKLGFLQGTGQAVLWEREKGGPVEAAAACKHLHSEEGLHGKRKGVGLIGKETGQ